MRVVIAQVERSRGRYNIFVNDRLYKSFVTVDVVLKYLRYRYRKARRKR